MGFVMDKKIILLVAVFVLLLGSSFASSVTRSFAGSMQPGADLEVTLTVEADGGESFYAIDELVPEGWTVKDSGTGAAEHAGHIKWVVIEAAENTSYSYTLTAPSQEGIASFSGTYMFESMLQETGIAGATEVNVKAAQTPPATQPTGQGIDYITIAIAVVLIVIVLAVAFKFGKAKVKK